MRRGVNHLPLFRRVDPQPMHFVQVQTFDQWRSESRRLLASEIPPADIHWIGNADHTAGLFDLESAAEAQPESHPVSHTVPKAFLDLARAIACHRDRSRWELLYRVLWRITHDEANLLKIVTDDDVHQLGKMQKAVNRDVHKMKAFVRFRKVVSESDDGRPLEQYIAWHRPDHFIVRLAAPFFARRFKAMNWTILTPHESVSWNQAN